MAQLKMLFSLNLDQIYFLTLSQTSPGFYVFALSSFFENTAGKGEIARNQQFVLFPRCFLPLPCYIAKGEIGGYSSQIH